jgi:UDP-N-acetylmuramate dehydrogenase
MDIKEKLPRIKKNIPLRDYTTFKIGGPARYFFEAKTKEDLILAIKTAKEFNLPFFVLAGGSNVLVSDKGYKGLVIHILDSKFQILNSNVVAEAGAKLSEALKAVTKKDLAGLEWAAGIPGTVGGAVYGNAGAFWFSMQDIVRGVKALDLKTLKIKNISLKDCAFSSKDSIFKHNKNLIILSVVLKLKRGNKKQIRDKIEEYVNYRKEKHPLDFPSAGCIFKNYTPEIKNQKLFKKFPELVDFNKKGRIPSAYLIEKCGLKEKRVGDAQISGKHANFIVNLRNAKADDVKKLIRLIKQKVKNKFGITLEEEIQYLDPHTKRV